MSVLDQICDKKRAHIRTRMAQMPLPDLKLKIKEIPTTIGFKNNILSKKSQGQPALIAEVKKASPSKGVIRADFDPVEIATTYEQAGATCLSVLTDEPYFQGHDDYLVAVKAAVKIPVLRKDFMIDPYQIYESRALGADCILLIMAALDDVLAKELYDLTHDLGMDVLVEVHDREELDRAIALGADMIGINNRNLKTLDVSLQTSYDLRDDMPDHVLKIAESGIYTNADLTALHTAGFDAFLVGESLMRQDDIAAAVKNLMTGT
ncbi:MAG: indole-3-glycerol phosphate synthase TrpC [Rhodospirillales bacterium]|nr:indole-3-glycerol phosphate synthase TrpC [Rhodospirillales bacterium]